MLFKDAVSFAQDHWVTLSVLLALSCVSYSYIRAYFFLRGFNGPFLAKLSNFWQLWDTLVDLERPPLQHVHAEYGKAVRIGPDVLSFSSADAARDIYYGVGRDWPKSEAYRVMGTFTRGAADEILFSSTNKPWHDNIRRCVNAAYSMGSIRQYEAIVDSKVDVLVEQLQKRFADQGNRAFDATEWFCFFSTDVITAVTWGRSWQCLETGSDTGGIMKQFDADLRYAQKARINAASDICPMPVLDKFLRKNPVLGYLDRLGLMNKTPPTIAIVASEFQKAREEAADFEKPKVGTIDDPTLLVDQIIRARRTNPDIMTELDVLKLGVNTVFAGADTTGITITALFYHLLRTPHAHAALLHELRTHFPHTPPTHISYARAASLPYLAACIKETFRLHPVLRITPSRIVTTPGGATIAGQHVPHGTVVGVNPWVAHYDPAVFGPDTRSFVPERWLASPTAAPEDAAAPGFGELEGSGAKGGAGAGRGMNSALLHFGAGNFNCIGKNLALVEMYKCVPRVLLAFPQMGVVGAGEWRLDPQALMKPVGLEFRLGK
ncbi:cytochrome P450 [Neofusicoccum parvum]|nr:cytochrome P450 [Neofusicoccum parvum]